MLKLTYISKNGTAELWGGGKSPLRVTEIEGLGLAEKEYQTASFAGYDGQETISARYLQRSITVSGDVQSGSAREALSKAVEILMESGYLYITDGDFKRRIYCNQTAFPDAKRVLRGKIATFAIQFVCDSPFFEDAENTVVALYKRQNNIPMPFTLPRAFTTTVTGASVNVSSRTAVEPVIEIRFSKAAAADETIAITNKTTDKKISLAHTPVKGEIITVDIKNRSIVSSANGNIIDELTDDTFLSDFKLIYGENEITVSVGSIYSGITVGCEFNNSYASALII